MKSLESDVVIIGSGPAGLVTALNLDPSLNILIIEAGKLQYDEGSQELYAGKTVGDKYFDLRHCRLRQFGGSSGHWEGFCRTLDNFDFEYKAYAKEAHWPINRGDLSIYLHQAARILKINPTFFQKSSSLGAGIESINFEFSPPVRFGEGYEEILRGKGNIRLMTESALVEARIVKNKIEDLIILTGYSEKTVIKAKIYVFAMGGIENSRILKIIASQNPSADIGKNINVGAYWMEHPYFDVGTYLSDSVGGKIEYFCLADNVKKTEGILNCGIRLLPNSYRTNLFKEYIYKLSCINEALSKKVYEKFNKKLSCEQGGLIKLAWEQEPRFDNRIDLSASVDKMGLPKVVHRWKKSTLDLKTARISSELMANAITKTGHGIVNLNRWLWSGSYPEDGAIGGNHHLGGTRMSASSKNGVVDPSLNCWNLSNLYIAGSSVFPSAGHANPTLTVVQLSLRLADHLNSMRGSWI